MPRMAMGTRQTEQPPLWVATSDLPASPGHPFYTKLNAILDAEGFDRFAEDQCRRFYAPTMGRPSLEPGRYFRLLLIGYFEGLDAERGIAWRAADSSPSKYPTSKDRKSTRLNSSHRTISYAVFCLKKKKN